ncbi:hypothetical protein J6590_038034 [Homalodisca vitripennis]|nr:hypothetical protein J6590_038034 [Homalodisca vitripennis]
MNGPIAPCRLGQDEKSISLKESSGKIIQISQVTCLNPDDFTRPSGPAQSVLPVPQFINQQF